MSMRFKVWLDIVDTLEKLIPAYDMFNEKVSLGLARKTRLYALSRCSIVDGMRVLDMGIGPGAMSRFILERARVELVGLDYSLKMLKTVLRDPFLGGSVENVRGVFEHMPFKGGIFDLIFASFALQDSLHWKLIIRELYSLCKRGGVVSIVNIGKPDDRLFRFLMTLYMRYLMPLLARAAVSDGGFKRKPWQLLITIFDNLPANKELGEEILSKFGNIEIRKFLLGGIIVITAKKR